MSSTPLTILHGGHRKVLRIGANDSMSTVVQMARREFGLDSASSSSLVLKHKRNVVDLSQPFRFTGIPQNATLQLEEGPATRRGGAAGSGASGGGQVRVAMRLPGGGRVQASFSCETTLAGLLAWWAERGEIDTGVLQQGPSLQFMRTAYGAAEIESTTLRSIGLQTGSAMFTLSLSSPRISPTSGSKPAVAAGASSSMPSAGRYSAEASAAAAGAATAQEEADIARAIALSAAEIPMDTATSAPIPPPPVAETLEQKAPLPAAAAVAAPAAAAARAVVGAGEDVATAEMDVASERDAREFPEGGGGGVSREGEMAAAGRAFGGVGGDRMEAEGMDVEAGDAAEQPNKPDLPAMGVGTCRAALEAMVAGHFDSDSAACVITLAKMVDNVVHRPDDARTRQIRCANATFQQKVGRIRGGTAFLEGVGFVSNNEEEPHQLLGGGGSGAGGGGRMLVLTPDREDLALLKEARVLLTKQAEVLGVPRDRMPQPPRAPARPSPPASAQGIAFDPYKPFMTSTAPTPKGSQEQSSTEKRLEELRAKKANVVAGGVPERNIQVTLPSQVAAANAAGKGVSGAAEGGSGGGSSGGGGGGGSEERGGGDGGLIAKKVARQMAERKKREDVPFQTKAMREIEQLQKATVYRTTVIKVQFSDRVVLQATFASTEGVKELYRLVRSCLGEAYCGREFQLYVSPPRMLLKEGLSLSDAGLVPAALVYVSWKEVPPAGETEGGYLRPDLTSAGGGSTVARPVGVVLDGGTGAEESKMGGRGGRALGGARGSGSGSGGKRTGKPSWLKIN